MPEPLVSVVIPARNEEAYVAAAIDSIASQSVPRRQLEVVVVVNGSIDNTSEVVRETRGRLLDLAIRLQEIPEPGVSRAKNLGVGMSSGEMLIFLDADSRMAPDLVDRILVAYGAGTQAGSVTIVSDGGDWLDRGFFGLLEFGKRLFGIHANMLFCTRASFDEAGGFDEAMHQAEDRDLLVRLGRSGLPLARITESRIYTSPRRLHEGRFRVGLVRVFARWSLGHAGVWRTRPY